jgi:acetyltransferase-like isoleucine patch superfamily enzyme
MCSRQYIILLKRVTIIRLEHRSLFMTQDKKSNEKTIISYITNIRKNVFHIHPKQFLLGILQFFAMFSPFKWRAVFQRLRGAKIDKNALIGPLVFFDEIYPELITIRERADIGPGVLILTHDSMLYHLDLPKKEARTAEVVIGRNCYIGAGTIILPGVTIGDNSIIGAGSVVTKSIPPGSMAMGIPAKVVCSRDEWIQKHLVNT